MMLIGSIVKAGGMRWCRCEMPFALQVLLGGVARLGLASYQGAVTWETSSTSCRRSAYLPSQCHLHSLSPLKGS